MTDIYKFPFSFLKSKYILYERCKWWKWSDIFLTDVTSPQFITSTKSPSEKMSWSELILKLIMEYTEVVSPLRSKIVLCH